MTTTDRVTTLLVTLAMLALVLSGRLSEAEVALVTAAVLAYWLGAADRSVSHRRPGRDEDGP